MPDAQLAQCANQKKLAKFPYQPLCFFQARAMPWPVLPWWPKAWNPFSRWTWANSYDYETLLDSLEKEIQSTESTLTDIRARKRRAIHNVLQIMITLWIISLIVLWVFSSFFWGQEWAASRSLVVVLLLLGTPLFLSLIHI